MKEVWKKIDNYNEYEISNLGNVRSLKNDKVKLLKQFKCKSGYMQVILCSKSIKKVYLVHRLVAQAFIKNKYGYKEINHKDENKLNNCVDNLEWCTRAYNMNYGDIKKKQSECKKIKVAKYTINGKLIKIYKSIKEASSENNLKSTNIVKCCKHKEHYNTCGNYKWEYV